MSEENNKTDHSEEDYKKIGKNSIYIFFWIIFVICLMKCISDTYIKDGSQFIDYKLFNNQKNTIMIVSLLLFFFLFFTNLELSSNDLICGNRNIKVAFMSTFIPFLFIYVLTMIIIILILPGWVRIFSNTFGLTIAKMCYPTLIKNIFQQSGDKSLQFQQLYNDPYVYLNEIELSKIEIEEQITESNESDEVKKDYNITNLGGLDFLPDNIKSQLFDIPSKNINNNNLYDLMKFLNLKDTIGYFIWITLIGMITILISLNYLLTESCGGKKNNKKKEEWLEEIKLSLNSN